MSKKQEVIGLALAPLFPAMVAAVLVGARRTEFDSDTALAIASICIAGGYLAGFGVAWPLLRVWRKLGWTGPVAGAGLGLVAATCLTLVLTAALIRFSRGDVSLIRGFLNLLTFTAPIGAAAGLAFWWFGMRSPNKPLQSTREDARA